ncbi:uncharacterized protein LOC115615379 [Strigops habroptila]|uniref:uncharacterized protein LOC115615379 n=1 Tax=Strigops habroptila TaxID=2489341 RepID=UPI0011CF1072|nr:uncharacterized protein LOC115615379 [Strigops habroptila]
MSPMKPQPLQGSSPSPDAQKFRNSGVMLRLRYTGNRPCPENNTPYSLIPCPLDPILVPPNAAPKEEHFCPAGGRAQPLSERGQKELPTESKELVGAEAGAGPGLCPGPAGREHGRSPLPSLLWQVLKPLPLRKVLKRSRRRILQLHAPACQSWLFQHVLELEDEAASRTKVGLQEEEEMEVDVEVEEEEAMEVDAEEEEAMEVD